MCDAVRRNSEIKKGWLKVGKTRCEMRKKASLLYTRAYILGLPYKTIWEDYLEDWEKEGYEFEEVVRWVKD
jgi:hypothetical protein